MRQVNLVNNQDLIIGHTDLLDAHRGQGKRHQAVSLFLFHQNPTGVCQLLVQQRSAAKIVGNLQWANTLCANLVPSENHLHCLKRRALQELGIKWQSAFFLKEIVVFPYQVTCENGFAENEIDHIFVSIVDDEKLATLKILPNPAEVANYAWLNWSSVKNKKMGKRVLTPWFSLFLDSKLIIEKIDETLTKQLARA